MSDYLILTLVQSWVSALTFRAYSFAFKHSEWVGIESRKGSGVKTPAFQEKIKTFYLLLVINYILVIDKLIWINYYHFRAFLNDKHFTTFIQALQPLSLKCDPQSSMSLSPTSISPTFNQRLKLKIIINSCLKWEILDERSVCFSKMFDSVSNFPLEIPLFISAFWLMVGEMLVGERDIKLWGSHFNDNGCNVSLCLDKRQRFDCERGKFEDFKTIWHILELFIWFLS